MPIADYGYCTGGGSRDCLLRWKRATVHFCCLDGYRWQLLQVLLHHYRQVVRARGACVQGRIIDQQGWRCLGR